MMERDIKTRERKMKNKGMAPMDEKENMIRSQLHNTIKKTDFRSLLRPRTFYEGKVRDNYSIADGRRIIITTDRISCFDVIVGTVPFKGQLLNQMATFWFDKTKHIVKNHIIEIPDQNVMVVQECKPLPIEMIVRRHITGSLWRAYASGTRSLYGINFSEGLKKNQRFEKPMLTPSTKAEHGAHDEPISKTEIIARGLVTQNTYEHLEKISLALFARGEEIAAKQGLILVDTKYEFGMSGDEIVLIDEIHTPDSSRFWYIDQFEERFKEGKDPLLLDKEYVRQWLLERGFGGEGTPPALTDEVRIEAARRYIEAFETVTGTSFTATNEPVLPRIERNLHAYLKKHQ